LDSLLYLLRQLDKKNAYFASSDWAYALLV